MTWSSCCCPCRHNNNKDAISVYSSSKASKAPHHHANGNISFDLLHSTVGNGSSSSPTKRSNSNNNNNNNNNSNVEAVVQAQHIEGRLDEHDFDNDDDETDVMDDGSDRHAVAWLRSRSLIRLQEQAERHLQLHLQQHHRQQQVNQQQHQQQQQQQQRKDKQQQQPQKNDKQQEQRSSSSSSSTKEQREPNVNSVDKKNIAEPLSLLSTQPPSPNPLLTQDDDLLPGVPSTEDTLCDFQFIASEEINWPPLTWHVLTTEQETTTTTTTTLPTPTTIGPNHLTIIPNNDDDDNNDRDHHHHTDDHRDDDDDDDDNNMEAMLVVDRHGSNRVVVTSPSSSKVPLSHAAFFTTTPLLPSPKLPSFKSKSSPLALLDTSTDSTKAAGAAAAAAAATAKERYLQACRTPKSKEVFDEDAVDGTNNSSNNNKNHHRHHRLDLEEDSSSNPFPLSERPFFSEALASPSRNAPPTPTNNDKTTGLSATTKAPYLPSPNTLWSSKHQRNLKLLHTLQSELVDSNNLDDDNVDELIQSPPPPSRRVTTSDEKRPALDEKEVKGFKRRVKPLAISTTSTTTTTTTSTTPLTSPKHPLSASPHHPLPAAAVPDSPAKRFATTTASWLLCSPRNNNNKTEHDSNNSSNNAVVSNQETTVTSTDTSPSSVSSSSSPPPPTTTTLRSMLTATCPTLPSPNMNSFPMVILCPSRRSNNNNKSNTNDTPTSNNNSMEYPSPSFILTPPLMEALRGFLPISQSENHFWLKYSLQRGDGASLSVMLQKIHASTYTLICIETKSGHIFGSFTSTPWRRKPTWFGSGQAFLWQVPQSQSQQSQQQDQNKNNGNNTPTATTTPTSKKTLQQHLQSTKKMFAFDQHNHDTTTLSHHQEVKVYPYTGHDDMVQYCSSKALAVGGGAWDSPLHPLSMGNTVSNNNNSSTTTTTENPYANEPSGIGLLLDADLLGGETNSCATFCNPRLCSTESSNDKTKKDAQHQQQQHSSGSSSNEFEIANVEVWTLTPCTTLEAAESLELRKLFVEEHATTVATTTTASSSRHH